MRSVTVARGQDPHVRLRPDRTRPRTDLLHDLERGPAHPQASLSDLSTTPAEVAGIHRSYVPFIHISVGVSPERPAAVTLET